MDVARVQYPRESCSLATTLEVVGERWTLLILRDLFFGVQYFNDLKRDLGLPGSVLSRRLAKLQDAGIITRHDVDHSRSEITLTPLGRGLWPVLHSLFVWGDQYLADQGQAKVFTHVHCGEPITSTGRCSKCDFDPDVADIAVRPGPRARTVPRPATDPKSHVSAALGRGHRLLTPLLSDQM